MSTTTTSGDHVRDACGYSIEVAKQFITLSTACIAFLVGFSITGVEVFQGPRAGLAIVLFGISALFGLVYLMAIVGQVARTQSYDIYAGRLRWLALIEILAFVAGVVLLTTFVF